MVNVVGFSRGGTHIFWCFISSHSSLKNSKIEVNDLVGRNRLGIIKKLILELHCLLGLYSNYFDLIERKEVYKAVCSWYPNIFFQLFQRHDPMKYIENTSFNKRKTVFLVKSLDAQSQSWMQRGATKNLAEKAYYSHLKRWKSYAEKQDCLFIDYGNFCKNPISTIEKIWSWLDLPYEVFPPKVEIKPKAYKGQPEGLNAESAQRRWEFVDSDQLIASLKVDGEYST